VAVSAVFERVAVQTGRAGRGGRLGSSSLVDDLPEVRIDTEFGTPAGPPPIPPRPRNRLRGRHIRAQAVLRMPVPLTAAQTAIPEDRLVLQALRRCPAIDLDAAQVAALAALPPSVTASALDRLVRTGLARDALVHGTVRFGLP
jgi:hypothetical protein